MVWVFIINITPVWLFKLNKEFENYHLYINRQVFYTDSLSTAVISRSLTNVYLTPATANESPTSASGKSPMIRNIVTQEARDAYKYLLTVNNFLYLYALFELKISRVLAAAHRILIHRQLTHVCQMKLNNNIFGITLEIGKRQYESFKKSQYIYRKLEVGTSG